MNKLIKWSIYGLVFLMPLMFLPLTAEVLEFPKQMILVVLTATALIGWLGKILAEKRLSLRVSVLDLAVLIFLGIWGAATLVSQSPYGSLVGIEGNVADSFVSILCFGVLYFVIVNNIGRRTEESLRGTDADSNAEERGNESLTKVRTPDTFSISGILKVFLISAGVTLVLAILGMVGLKIFPWVFGQGRAFNTIGTLSALGIFSGLVLCVLALRYENRSLKAAIPSGILALLCLLTLIFINFWILWLGLALVMGFVLVLSIAIPEPFKNKSLMLVMAVVLIALVFLFVRAPLVNLNLPAEVSLSQKASFGIARETLREHPLLGSGPNTFGFDYSKWRSLEINDTLFWNIRFNQASSKFTGMLATTGILGMIGFFLMVVGFFWLAIKRADKADLGGLSGKRFAILIPFLFLLLAIFLYSSNLTLTFFFFLFFALNAGVGFKRRKLKLTLAYSPRANQVLTFVSLILILLIASGLFFEAKRVMAQVYFKKAIAANIEARPAQEVRMLMAKAVELEPNEDSLWRNLSHALLFETSEKINQQASQEEIQALIAYAISTAKRATELSPHGVANWQARGIIYENLIGLAGGAERWARESYEKAITLEPNNPYLYNRLGRVYLVTQDETEVYEAIKWFEKAVTLKGDYSPAHFQLALAYEMVGDLDKAIEKMESNKRYTPDDVGLRFQLGLMYYKKENFERARAEFAEAIRLNPIHSNSRYFLGLIYDQEGKTEQAIGQFEEIERLNPDNQEVKTILVNLKAGKSAFGVEKVEEIEELPIEEEGPEVVPASPGL